MTIYTRLFKEKDFSQINDLLQLYNELGYPTTRNEINNHKDYYMLLLIEENQIIGFSGMRRMMFYENNELDNELNKGIAARAAKKPSGKKNYSVSVRSAKSRWVPGFSHTLRGTFTYSKGKVNKYSRNVVASGTAYTHTKSSKAVRLDKSLVEITSVSKHKWLGKVGKISGLGYTSYLGVDLYGSGNYRLKYARYQPGL